MSGEAVQETLSRLVEKMTTEYTQSEVDIARALAAADGPLSTEALAEETGYTERTIKKRVGTLEEQLHGEPLLVRDEEDNPQLHPEFAAAVRNADL